MVTVILPGFSSKNKEWATTTAKRLELPYEVRPILWEHWDNPNMEFDAEDKAREIIEVLLDSEVNIVAKSIGTLVAAHMINIYTHRVRKVVFCGIPLRDITESEKDVIKEGLRDFPPEQILVIQNDKDPHGSALEVKEFLLGIDSRIEVRVMDRTDHEYPYYADFQDFLMS